MRCLRQQAVHQARQLFGVQHATAIPVVLRKHIMKAHALLTQVVVQGLHHTEQEGWGWWMSNGGTLEMVPQFFIRPEDERKKMMSGAKESAT